MQYMNRRLRKTILLVAMLFGTLFSLLSMLSISSYENVLREAIIGEITNETANSANQMSSVLENAEGTVNAMSAAVTSTFDMEKYRADQQYVDEYISRFDPVLYNAIKDLNNTVGLFFTFSVDLVGQKEGYEIWYVYDDDGNISFLDAAANGKYLEAFTEYDAEYMQFYFNAVNDPGKGVWVGPIYDPDIDEQILTYSRAVFVEDTLIGVMGIDINTRNTIDMVMSTDLESKGDIALFNQNGRSIVDSFDEYDKLLKIELNEMAAQDDSPLKKDAKGAVSRSVGGEKLLISWSRLSNDWILVVSNVERTIFAPVTLVKVLVITLSVCLVIMLTAGIYFILKRYDSPLREALHLLKLMDLENSITEEDRREIEDEDDIARLVKKHISLQRNKDIMIANQSRLAQTGKYMTNVAHQWKQPLNNINLIMGNLTDDYVHGELSADVLGDYVEKTQKITRMMSETIDSFNKYLKPEDEPSMFSPAAVIDAALQLLTDPMRRSNIRVETETDSGLMIPGYPNAFYHVILNVLTNAIDASCLIPQNERLIRISVHSTAGRLQDGSQEAMQEETGAETVIIIYNRGPQLSENVKKNLFTSYFTTKGENGTGLGLPISKNIIEKSMGGSIALDNADGGVACVIVLPQMCGKEPAESTEAAEGAERSGAAECAALGETREADDGKRGIS